MPWPVREGFFPEVPISGHITGADILSLSPIQLDADWVGTDRWFASPDGKVGFEGELYKELIRLAEDIHKRRFIKDSLSFRSLVDWIGDWLLQESLGKNDVGLTAYIEQRRAAAVQAFQCLVPLSEPFVESPFEIGKTRVRSQSTRELLEWFPDDPDLSRGFKTRTVVEFDILAEPNYAAAAAWERANRVSSLLRLLSDGILSPRSGSNCVPLGTALFQRQEVLIRNPNGELDPADELIDYPVWMPWSLGNEAIQQHLPYLNSLAELMDTEAPSAFQAALLGCVLLYSRVALTREPTEKLVYLFAAVESLLQAGEHDPVQATISDRFAFLVGASADDRAKTARSIRLAYALRSRFVHRGETVDRSEDLATVKELQRLAKAFFSKAVRAQHLFEKKEDFVRALDRMKWGDSWPMGSLP